MLAEAQPVITCRACACTIGAQSMLELRTRFPRAPAALARVLYSSSVSSSVSGRMAPLSAWYSAAL